jgi:PBP1b-binding outer membrane lipoprotein LpoB
MRKKVWLALAVAAICLAAGCGQPAAAPDSSTTEATQPTTTSTTERTDVPLSTATTREHQFGETSVRATSIDNAASIPERDVKNLSAFVSSRQDVLLEAINCTCTVETTQFDLGDIDARAVRYNDTLYGIYVQTV